MENPIDQRKSKEDFIQFSLIMCMNILTDYTNISSYTITNSEDL